MKHSATRWRKNMERCNGVFVPVGWGFVYTSLSYRHEATQLVHGTLVGSDNISTTNTEQHIQLLILTCTICLHWLLTAGPNTAPQQLQPGTPSPCTSNVMLTTLSPSTLAPPYYSTWARRKWTSWRDGKERLTEEENFLAWTSEVLLLVRCADIFDISEGQVQEADLNQTGGWAWTMSIRPIVQASMVLMGICSA